MSVVFLDPSHLLHEINEYRMSHNMRFLMPTQFLAHLSKDHCKNIINAVIPFSLENVNIRKNKLSSVVANSQEIIGRIGEDRNILETLIAEEETRNILQGNFNLIGLTIYRIATTIHVHMILAETY